MTTVTVSSAAQLTAAINSATDGETILLKAGEYDGLNLRNLTFAQGITIASADPTHEADLTNFAMKNVQGVNFSNLELTANGGPTAGFAFQIYSSSNISFDHVYAHGSLDGNSSDDAGGIIFSSTNNVKVTNSEFTQLRQGVAVVNADNVVLSNNYVHNVEKSGFVLGGASDVQVNHNTISSIEGINGEHPDAIQFYTTGTTTEAHDINVSDNVILRGTGGYSQGIFFRDQVGDLPYQNVTVANNFVEGTGYGGIYVEGVNGLDMTGNELVSVPGKIFATWARVENGTNVTSTDNQAISITFDANTHPVESGDTLNTAVTDGGAASIDAWAASHPGAGSTLASLSTAASVAASTASAIDAAAAAEGTTTTAATATTALATNVATTTATTSNLLALAAKSNVDAIATVVSGTAAATTTSTAPEHFLTATNNETFTFGPGSGHEVIQGFGANGTHESIDITGYLEAGMKPMLANVGGDMHIVFSNGDEIDVLGQHWSFLKATSTGWVI